MTMQSADVVVEDARGWGGSGGGGSGGGGGVVWYHRNETSMVGFTVEHQGLLTVKDAKNPPSASIVSASFVARALMSRFSNTASMIRSQP